MLDIQATLLAWRGNLLTSACHQELSGNIGQVVPGTILSAYAGASAANRPAASTQARKVSRSAGIKRNSPQAPRNLPGAASPKSSIDQGNLLQMRRGRGTMVAVLV